MVETDNRGAVRTHRQTFSWSSANSTLEQLIRDYSLPQVVRLEPKGDALQTLATFDIAQPLYLYSDRNVRKVTARNLRAAETELGENNLIIPEDYAGWFVLLRSSDSHKHYYETIRDLATSNATEFLITGRLGGYQVVCAQDGEYSYDKRDFLPGDVLRIGKTYVGKRKVRDESSIFRRKKEIDVYYLKCLDDKDREILFSFETKGKFYVVSYPNGKTSRCVMQIPDILKKCALPVSVHLVYGRLPTAPCSFTGYLKLTSSFPERTIIASTIIKTKNIFLELSQESPIPISVARQTPEFHRNVMITQAVRFCNEQAQQYARGIKVSLEYESNPANWPLPPIPQDRTHSALENVAVVTDSSNNIVYSIPHAGRQTSQAAEYLNPISDMLNTDSSADYVNALRASSSSERSSPDTVSSDCISLSDFLAIQPAEDEPDFVTTAFESEISTLPTLASGYCNCIKSQASSSENATSSAKNSKLKREQSEDDYEFLWYQGTSNQEQQQIPNSTSSATQDKMTVPGCRISVEGSYLLYPIFLDNEFSKQPPVDKEKKGSTDNAISTLGQSDERLNQAGYMQTLHPRQIMVNDVSYTPLQLHAGQAVNEVIPSQVPNEQGDLEESPPPPIPPRRPTRSDSSKMLSQKSDNIVPCSKSSTYM